MRSIEMESNIIQLDERREKKRKKSAERVRSILGNPTLKSELLRLSVEVTSRLNSLFEVTKKRPKAKIINIEDLRQKPVA